MSLKSKKWQCLRWVVAPLLIFAVVKLYYLVLHYPSINFHHAINPFYANRCLAGFVVLGVWGSLAFILYKALQRGHCRMPLPLLFLAIQGLTMIGVFLIQAAGVSLNAMLTHRLLILPIFLAAFLAWALGRMKSHPQHLLKTRRQWHGWLRAAAMLIVGLGIFRVVWAAGWLLLMKSMPTGDEVYVWWLSTDTLLHRGLSGLLADPGASSYSPGYPFFANILMAVLPRYFAMHAEPILPLCFGGLAILLIFTAQPRRGLTLPWLALMVLLLNLLLIAHLWIYAMFFQLWYGEAFAVIVIACLFQSLDLRLFQPSSLRWEAILLFGLGVVARFSKPPLEILLLPAILPLLLAGTWLAARQKAARLITRRLLWLALGACVAHLVWSYLLTQANAQPYFKYSLSALKSFNWASADAPLVSYFLLRYKQVLLLYLTGAILALMLDWRRFTPSLLASAALCASIFVLYGTVWQDREYESGARYFLHGMYGWSFYFLSAKGAQLVACVTSRRHPIGSARRPEDCAAKTILRQAPHLTLKQ
jgi:hypothetical protein